MSFQTLDISDDTLLSAIFSQIDVRIYMSNVGDPSGVLAAAIPGVFCFDTDFNNIYYATQADGTIDGTTWQIINVGGTAPAATTSTAGIVVLASQADAAAGTDNTKALTPYAASIFVQGGSNSSITSLSGLTTALSIGQGGTGGTTAAGAMSNLLPSYVSGQFLTNNGTSLSWSNPGLTNVLIVSSNSTLSAGVFHLITNNSLTLTLPNVPVGSKVQLGFIASVSTGPTINTSSSQLIMGVAAPMTVDTLVSFTLLYTGTTYGWWIV